MLNVQNYLKSGKSLEDLNTELGINVTKHPTLPLAILNYDMIESPKTHPIVRECRALTLNTESYDLVSRSFWRFYNFGEVLDEYENFDWSTCKAQAKEDGSLIKFYFFDGEWHVNTRGSFANGPMFGDIYDAKRFNLPEDFSWKDGILRALGVKDLKELNLDPSVSYSCEFCSLWNKVVREYKEPKVYLLSRFVGEEEIGPADTPCFHSLAEYQLDSAESILHYVNNQPEATFEGIVIKDDKFNRWKLKNERWKALSHMKGNNGQNLYNPKYLVPFILDGNPEIVFTNFPEVIETYNEYKEKVENAYSELEPLWVDTWRIENQKEFALAIIGKTKFTSVLFNLRKELGKDHTLEALKKHWKNNVDGVLKVLFNK